MTNGEETKVVLTTDDGAAARRLHRVCLGLGTNLGDRKERLREAVRLLDERLGRVMRQSSVIETEPWGFASDNSFLNAAILCETDLTPREVLGVTQQIERDMGKTVAHATRRSHADSGNGVAGSGEVPTDKDKGLACEYHDRPIDIDILLYDDLTVDEPDLKIPHPLMLQRDFVMRPLSEILSEEEYEHITTKNELV